MATKQYILEGLCCPNCAVKIERGVGAIAGVSSAAVDFANQRLTVEIGDRDKIDSIVTEAGSVVQRAEPSITMSEIASDALSTRSLWLYGLDCADCAAKIERRIAGLDGVDAASVDVMAQKLTITASDRTLLPSLLRQAARIASETEEGIDVSFAERSAAASVGRGKTAWLARIRMAAGVALFAAGVIFDLEPRAELAVFLASYLLIGGEVVSAALKNISRGQVMDENFLMSIATVGAFAIGEYPEGVAVMLFYQVGEAFQRYAVGRSRKSITSLMDIRPDSANLKTDDGTLKVSPEEVGAGEVIIVRPGEKIPLDGVILEGRSTLDTSALTGESLPRDVEPGAEVLSGSINKGGLLTVRVTKEFGESTVSKILNLVQNASGAKAPVENFITKFARYYTPAVVAAAVALALIPPMILPGAALSDWLKRALVFLVVSCPCALVISIPLSFFGGIGGASRKGILVKGSNFLEALNSVDTVVFDKTGTLTKGVFAVTDIVPADGFSRDGLLSLAAHAEAGSNHPIAASILNAWGRPVSGESVSDYEEIAGHGVRVRADGREVIAGNAKMLDSSGIAHELSDALGTIVYVAVDGTFAGYVVISDEIKPDGASAIKRLKAIGVKKTVMLTGDSRAVGEKIGSELGFDSIYSELLPHQKVEKLEEMERAKTGKGNLLFVGDGINDAPVLARADVGIAMGGLGADAAIEAADVVLMTDEPSKIADAILIAKKTRRIVWQNIVFALAVKAVVLTFGAMGMATMWEAVFGDVGVAVIAVLNAMRAMKV
ncbi:MAG: cadmium-translocating P-type ATPase [Synergistaceae bacterium]|jgi:Cd2+/Zn2+-exporting ATPase|nr:cadmium-translocating P-type ATPase [Synergistaceae bacterium]